MPDRGAVKLAAAASQKIQVRKKMIKWLATLARMLPRVDARRKRATKIRLKTMVQTEVKSVNVFRSRMEMLG